MNVSIPGLVTLAGLLVAYAVVVWPSGKKSVHLDVIQGFWAMFGMFVWATVLVNLVDMPIRTLVIYYALPSVCAFAWFMFLFRTSADPLTYTFSIIFLANALGGLFGLSKYKAVTIDILDVLLWVQLATLIKLGRTRLDPVLSQSPSRETQRESNIMKLAHGYGRTRTTGKT